MVPPSELGLCNTQQETYPQALDIISQHIDYLRFGPLSQNLPWDVVERRFAYLDITKVNYYGKWYCDLTGDSLELARTVEPMEDVLEWCAQAHWSRLDVAFDVLGIEIAKLPRPGTVICNNNAIETIYSHHLKERGKHDIFQRAYDAAKAGHDVPDGTVRFEVEFKRNYPDAIRDSENRLQRAFQTAACYIDRKWMIRLPVKNSQEIKPKKRLVSHSRERFYARYGKKIAADLADMGQEAFLQWVIECTKGQDSET